MVWASNGGSCRATARSRSTRRLRLRGASGSAGRVELESPVEAIVKSDNRAELRGNIAGFPPRLVVLFTGDVQYFALKHESGIDAEITFIDLDFDPDDGGASERRELTEVTSSFGSSFRLRQLQLHR